MNMGGELLAYHEALAHEVGFLDAVVHFTILAEAEENRVDAHLKIWKRRHESLCKWPAHKKRVEWLQPAVAPKSWITRPIKYVYVCSTPFRNKSKNISRRVANGCKSCVPAVLRNLNSLISKSYLQTTRNVSRPMGYIYYYTYIYHSLKLTLEWYSINSRH